MLDNFPLNQYPMGDAVMKWFSLLFLIVLFLFVATLESVSWATERPNVIFIVADDMGYADLGTQGARGFKTPHLDRMAAEGTRFTQFYVAQAVCTASRAALLTGCYPNRLGMQGAYKAMRTGYVDDAWAREHHEYWWEDVRAGKVPAQRSTPATFGGTGAASVNPADARRA